MTQVIHEIIIIGILSKIVLLMKNMELYYNCNCIRWRSHDIKSCSWIESRDLNRADLFPILRAITESDEISHLDVSVRMENSGQKLEAEVWTKSSGSLPDSLWFLLSRNTSTQNFMLFWVCPNSGRDRPIETSEWTIFHWKLSFQKQWNDSFVRTIRFMMQWNTIFITD